MNERSDTDAPGVLDPIAASRLIGRSYLRYLKARYAPADDRIRAELHDALDNRFQIDRGPFLQAASAYQKGHSLESLALEELLHRRVLDIDPKCCHRVGRCTNTRRLRFAKPPRTQPRDCDRPLAQARPSAICCRYWTACCEKPTPAHWQNPGSGHCCCTR